MKKKIGVFIMKMLNAYCFKTPWHGSDCSRCTCRHIMRGNICILESVYQKVARWTYGW